MRFFSSPRPSKEIGHNLNFAHSGKDNKEYADPIALMGGVYRSQTTWGKMCFNAAKSYSTGWYPSGNIVPESETFNGNISDLNSFREGSITTQNVSLKVTGTGETPLYLMLHRAEGITSNYVSPQADAHINRVNIVEQPENYSNGLGAQSWNVAQLRSGDIYTKTNWAGDGNTLKIEICGLSTGSPDQAKLIVYLEGVNYEYCGPCVDSELRIVRKGQKNRLCSFVAKKAKKRCKKRAFKVNCPKTCSTCEQYGCVDSPGKFKLKNGVKRTCTWVKKNEKHLEKRCAKPGVTTVCRKTCRYCEEQEDRKNMNTNIFYNPF